MDNINIVAKQLVETIKNEIEKTNKQIDKITMPDVLYAKWEKNREEPINPNDEIMAKDTCYLTDEGTKIQNEIIQEKNKAYIKGFGYVAPVKTKAIVVGSEGDINKMVGTME